MPLPLPRPQPQGAPADLDPGASKEPLPVTDLRDAEFAELDDLLAAAPTPLRALDAVTLDGYLCGVLVQPERIEAASWLPPIFDYDGQALPEGVLDTLDPAWWTRTRALVERRHAALRRAIAEDGWFAPFVLEPDEATAADAADAGPGPEAKGGVDATAPADAAPGEAADSHDGNASVDAAIGRPDAGRRPDPESRPDADTDDEAAIAALPPASRALMPWVAGFEFALSSFPVLAATADPGVLNTLARLYRHLPPRNDEERDLVSMMDRLHPLASLDPAIDDLVEAVVELSDHTERERYRVDTVRREAPKVGRNDPCPCGSGRKFKRCHGAG